MKYIAILFLLMAQLYAMPAINNEIEFTQPDGTTFKGHLKGDSAFNWIESNGDVIIYNNKDKFYYKAIVDKQKGLIPSSQKAGSEPQKSLYIDAKQIKKEIDQKQKEILKNLYKKAKSARNAPR